MSRIKYGMQKPVQNELQQCINSFERMKRGGIGIADELVCDACKRALKYIDELEDKLSKSVPVHHGHWIQRIRIITYYECSECHCSIYQENHYNYSDNIMVFPKYCEHCGAKMGGNKVE